MPPAATAGGIAVVIDVLRASTTMVTAVAEGAAGVWPVATLAEAHTLAERMRPAVVRGGERGGRRITGFDLGNSPLEYTRGRIGGREVVITTTNGTAAIAACSTAAETLVGAIVNRQAVARAVRQLAVRQGLTEVHLVCAGTDGEVSAEDVLGAGAILDAAIADWPQAGDGLDRVAADAIANFRQLAAAENPTAALESAFRHSPGGRNLLALGMAVDLGACARIDTRPVVPRLDRGLGRAVRMGDGSDGNQDLQTG